MADNESNKRDERDLIRAKEPTGAAIAIPPESAPKSAAHPEPTPDEVLAETELHDPDVGVDGTGVGELP
jgi:hypothetical protein